MKNRPLHENLDTSFVNLSGLLKYLRRRQFEGSVRIELSGYEADIYLSGDNQIRVREYDQIAGRIGEGEQALQRILIRSREPGGIIHVYQNVPEEKAAPEDPKPVTAGKPPIIEAAPAPAMPAGNGFTAKPAANGNGNGHVKKTVPETESKPVETMANQAEADAQPADEEKKSVKMLPDFPFELSNRVEEKARKTQISAADWQMLLNLSAELLRTVDNALANADLDFTKAFQKACSEIAADYPFFDPRAKTFSYANGKIRITEHISPKLFVAGINSSLRRIFDKLAGNNKFAEIHRYAAQKVAELIQNRRQRYDKFYFTPQLEKIIRL
jgi:hypothetical protein